MKLLAATPLSDWVKGVLASALAGVAFAFGENNVGFVVLFQIFCLVELLTCLLVSGLEDGKDFGWKQLLRFWLMKCMLMVVPLLGAGVDWAWYFMSGPQTFLGQDVHRYTTKAMLIGVLMYQFREVGRNVLYIYKDLPFLKRLMTRIDVMMNAGHEPPFHRRKYETHLRDKDHDDDGHQSPEAGHGSYSVRSSDADV